MTTLANAQANPTDFTYDANGNLNTITDALGRVTDSDHDPLNRLSRTLQDVGGITAETRQTLENIRRNLEAHGSALDKVVKCTVMLADIGDFEAMNGVYREYFPRNKPARSTFGVNGLARGARIEIECIATVK